MSLVYPVIHFLNRPLAFEMAEMAFAVGADGIFLISHGDADPILPGVARDIKALYPQKFVGINLLSLRAPQAFDEALEAGLDGLWADSPGVSSKGCSSTGETLQEKAGMAAAAGKPVEIFGSVAFKYQPVEHDPAGAAAAALRAGMVPTTSGRATGEAPEISKIVGMSRAAGGRLAIASGMDPENVDIYAPYLSHILVATGVSVDEHHFDREKLAAFVQIAHEAIPVDFDDLDNPPGRNAFDAAPQEPAAAAPAAPGDAPESNGPVEKSKVPQTSGSRFRQAALLFGGFAIFLNAARFSLAEVMRNGWPVNAWAAISLAAPAVIVVVLLVLATMDKGMRKRALAAFGAAYLMVGLLTFAKVA